VIQRRTPLLRDERRKPHGGFSQRDEKVYSRRNTIEVSEEQMTYAMYKGRRFLGASPSQSVEDDELWSLS
jgi:hypothetical protein